MPSIVDRTGYPVLNILYPGVRNSVSELVAAAYTQDNRVGNAQKVANTTLSANTPKGVLAGSVAGIHGDAIVGAASGSNRPVGVFVSNATGNPFENATALASGKVAYMSGAGSVVGVEVYETRNAADSGNLAYTAGQVLYTSANGLLTNETAASTVALAVVLKAPSASSVEMQIQMLV